MNSEQGDGGGWLPWLVAGGSIAGCGGHAGYKKKDFIAIIQLKPAPLLPSTFLSPPSSSTKHWAGNDDNCNEHVAMNARLRALKTFVLELLQPSIQGREHPFSPFHAEQCLNHGCDKASRLPLRAYPRCKCV